MSVVVRGCAIRMSYGRGSGRREVLHGVDVQVESGECLAIIGGSGSGKSTLTRVLLGLERVDSGRVEFDGSPVSGRRCAGYRALRRSSGLVTQHPHDSLDPRWTVRRSVGEPLAIRRREFHGSMDDAVDRALEQVGLDSGSFAGRYPDELSGGQVQRVAIARAMVCRPRLIVADEPMSAVDVSARLHILESFASLRRTCSDVALVVVSHDLGVVRRLADRVLVLCEGCVVESGTCDAVLGNPQHGYTKALVEAASL